MYSSSSHAASSNAKRKILVASGIDKLLSEVQSENARVLITVTEGGMYTSFNMLHPSNMANPISVNANDKCNSVSLLQNRNTWLSAVTVEFGIVTASKLEQPRKDSAFNVNKFSGSVILTRDSQSRKALDPILVTEFGICTLYRLEHPLKNPGPIAGTPCGRCTVSSNVQSLKVSNDGMTRLFGKCTSDSLEHPKKA